MEVLEDGGDVVITDLNEESGSRIKGVLKFIESFGGGTIDNTITVV